MRILFLDGRELLTLSRRLIGYPNLVGGVAPRACKVEVLLREGRLSREVRNQTVSTVYFPP
jgi:hypothetical protein